MKNVDFGKHQAIMFEFAIGKIKEFHKMIGGFFREYEKDYERWREKGLKEKIFDDTDGLSKKLFQESFGKISQRATWANHLAIIHLYSTLELHLVLVIERFRKACDAKLDASVDVRKGSGTTSKRIYLLMKKLKLEVDETLVQKFDTLRILRNCIVHNNGLPNESLLKTVEGEKLLPDKRIPVTDKAFREWCDAVTSYFGQFTEKLWEKEQELMGKRLTIED
jgi:hypothetical protein